MPQGISGPWISSLAGITATFAVTLGAIPIFVSEPGQRYLADPTVLPGLMFCALVGYLGMRVYARAARPAPQDAGDAVDPSTRDHAVAAWPVLVLAVIFALARVAGVPDGLPLLVGEMLCTAMLAGWVLRWFTCRGTEPLLV